MEQKQCPVGPWKQVPGSPAVLWDPKGTSPSFALESSPLCEFHVPVLVPLVEREARQSLSFP